MRHLRSHIMRSPAMMIFFKVFLSDGVETWFTQVIGPLNTQSEVGRVCPKSIDSRPAPI